MKTFLLLVFLFTSVVNAEPIKVMVIDTGVTPTIYTRKFIAESPTTDDYHDINSHGTHIAGIIINGNLEKDSVIVCNNVKLYSCKYYYPNEKYELDETIKCFNRAIKLKVDFINYSSTGPNPDINEKTVIQKASDLGIKIIAAAGNEGLDKLDYPAGYDIENLIAVGNMSYKGELSPYSNYVGGIVYDYGMNILSNDQYGLPLKMSGTSQAAAMYTHRLLLRKCSQIEKISKNTLPKDNSNGILTVNGGFNGKSSKSNSNRGVKFDWAGRIISESDF